MLDNIWQINLHRQLLVHQTPTFNPPAIEDVKIWCCKKIPRLIQMPQITPDYKVVRCHLHSIIIIGYVKYLNLLLQLSLITYISPN